LRPTVPRILVNCEVLVRGQSSGRGILFAAQLDSRTDLSGLDADHPDLARRFRQVQDSLNASALSDSDVLDQRKRWWTEHDSLLARISREPGWARSLLPPTWADLRPAAAGGTVVVINSGSRRSDVIVITADSAPISVPLPELTLADVDKHATELTRATTGASSFLGELRQQRVLTEVLS
jgi:hypothetical protein